MESQLKQYIARQIQRVINRIKALIRLASTEGDVNEGGWLPLQDVKYLGKDARSVPWFPYGFHARPKRGWQTLLYLYGARGENRVHMTSSARLRPKDLAPGEAVFYHPETRAEIRLKANGEIWATTRLFKIIGDLEVTGDALVRGGLNVIGVSSLDSALTVLGDTTLTDVVTSNSKDISDTHTHSPGSYADHQPTTITGTSGPVT